MAGTHNTCPSVLRDLIKKGTEDFIKENPMPSPPPGSPGGSPPTATSHLSSVYAANKPKYLPEPSVNPETGEDYTYSFGFEDVYPEMPEGLTKLQAEEWLKCKHDFIYWASKYAYIEVKEASVSGKGKKIKGGRMARFEPWPAQIELMRVFLEHKLHIILKARQLGISWLSGLFGLWRFTFHCHEHILIESRKEDEAVSLLGKIMMAFEKLPGWMKPRLAVNDTKRKRAGKKYKDEQGNILIAGLNSVMEAIATGGGAGSTVTVNIRDEAALVDDELAARTHKSSMPTLTSTDGWCFVISTAEGGWGFFYNLYWAAKRGDSEFMSHFLSWQARPDRDQAWYEREMRKFTNEDDFRNQYPGSDTEAFMVSGRTAFSRTSLNLLKKDEFDPKRLWEPTRYSLTASISVPSTYSDSYYASNSSKMFDTAFRTDRDGPVELWKAPESNAKYAVGADIAEGKLVNPDAPASKRGDFSVAAVVNIKTMEYVARIKTRAYHPNEFAREVSKLARAYNNAIVIPETNSGYGHAFMQSLREFYSNIYYRENAVDKFAQTITKEYGFLSTQKTRGLWINALAALVKDSPLPDNEKIYPGIPPLMMHGSDTVEELSKFIITKNGKAEAAQGEHDDEVVALGLCGYLIMNTQWGQHNFDIREEEKPPYKTQDELYAEYLARERAKWLDNLDKKPERNKNQRTRILRNNSRNKGRKSRLGRGKGLSGGI